MATLRERIKQITPVPFLDIARETRDGLQRAVAWPSATFHPWRRASNQKLVALKNIHRGERCFIIGNGPSLNNTGLSRLRNEYTMGMNRFYLMFPKLGFHTTYLISVNNLVIEQCTEDFRNLELPKFFSWRAHKSLFPNGEPDNHTHFLHTTYSGPRFAHDARERMWEGATVTNICLQLAYHMGFEVVILIGVDHSFVTKGKPNTTVISQGDDPNHFNPEYFGKGFRWQLPDLETSEIGYRLALQAYKKSNRRVLDATVGGKLQIFPKVAYESLF